MANVIPVEMKKRGRSRARAQYVLAGSVVALVGALVAILVMLPAYFALIVNSHTAVQSSQVVSAADRVSDALAVKHTNGLISLLGGTLQASSSHMDVISSVLARRSVGIHIDQIIYSVGYPSTLMLSGSADTNSEISEYRTTLSSDSRFTSVSVPVGALVGTDGGRFSLTILGNF